MDKKGKFALGIGGYVRATADMTLAASWTTWTSSLPTFRMPAK